MTTASDTPPILPSPAAERRARRPRGTHGRTGWRRTVLCLGLGLWGTLGVTGCPWSRAPDAPRPIEPHHNLEEIGEIAYRAAERAEDQGQWRTAFDAYARAEWAFEYHRRLTGRASELLVPAREGCDRVRARMR